MTRKAKRKTTDNVVSLFGATPPVPRAIPSVIEQLNGMLRLARDGHIHGFAYAYADDSGGTAWGWAGNADADRMLAAVARLNHAIVASDVGL